MNKVVVIHYHEIALKGQNRPFFEKALVLNIKKILGEPAKDVRRISGRILIEYNEKNKEEILKGLKKVFGIHHFSFAFVVEAEMEAIKQSVRSNFLYFKDAKSFRITGSRSEKHYSFTSHDIDVEVGALVHKEMEVPVDLDNPQKTLFVEVAENKAYLYDKKIKGPGGLPQGVSGKVVILISSGFDSPVAAWHMMKRGCEPIFVHFYSYPQTSRDSQENVEKIVEVLSGWSPNKLKLYFIPFLKIQEKIAASLPADIRVIMYRRWMLKIAQIIALEERAYALITGDSIAQVASQTLENIESISEAVEMTIIRPLAGFDKQEIIDKSRKIGTHDLSALPYDDCCSLFGANHPKTKSKVQEIVQAEFSMVKDLKILSEKAVHDKEEKLI